MSSSACPMIKVKKFPVADVDLSTEPLTPSHPVHLQNRFFSSSISILSSCLPAPLLLLSLRTSWSAEQVCCHLEDPTSMPMDDGEGIGK